MTAVLFENVSHHYGKTAALQAVSFSLAAGDSVGLVGPDGVGKSTLLSLLAGVKVIQAGRVEVFGEDMRKRAVREAMAHRIAFMPQGLGRNLYPTLSIAENIDFHANMFGLRGEGRAKRIARLLEATGLAPFADRAAGKLSGGMKQKLSLCCALVHSPELLVLDEPTTGVDPLSRRQFWTLVDALQAESAGMTVLVATAYMDEAERFAQLLAMDAGRLLVNRATREVMAQYGARTLEEAYIQLLPEEKRIGAGDFVADPFVPQAGAPPAMEAHDLTKRFGDFVAVDKVSFRIEQGEIFGFLGSNGCGKSTTMKMLTGLLAATSGTAQLLGQPIDAGNRDSRKRVGYMSQAFSLYEELSVRANLQLHADVYDLRGARGKAAVQEALERFELQAVAEDKPAGLPLGVRQRLQLAAACLHHPEVLILDEPTSGVDPAARDMFWRYLLDLSRHERITIFVSTHFMNEAARCDRMSLMDKGRVLAVGTPQEICALRGVDTLEEAFIAYLEDGEEESAVPVVSAPVVETKAPPAKGIGAWLTMLWTFAAREGRELLRDRIRLLIALFGPMIMLIATGWSISFDVNHIPYALLDQDQSAHSRALAEYFRGSPYFEERAELATINEGEAALQNGEVSLLIDIPQGFGRDLLMRRAQEVAFHADGSTPFNANNIQAYVQGIMQQYNFDLLQQSGMAHLLPATADVQVRFRYNPDFKSIPAIVPSVLMMALMLIPAMLTALAVVREREIGSIANLYASPAGVPQYLLGKQLPYIAIGMINYVLLVLLAVLWFGVPVKGSFLAMSAGALLLVVVTTGLGLLVSSLVRSQAAALFVTAIITLIPTLNYSGLLYPVSSMSGGAYAAGMLFPASWYQRISIGGFTKGLGWHSFVQEYAMLALFALVYLTLACLFLQKQEK